MIHIYLREGGVRRDTRLGIICIELVIRKD